MKILCQIKITYLNTDKNDNFKYELEELNMTMSQIKGK